MFELNSLDYYRREYAHDLRFERDTQWKKNMIETVAMNRLRGYRATRKGINPKSYINHRVVMYKYNKYFGIV